MAQQGGGQEICVVHLTSKTLERIAETSHRVSFRPVEVVQNVLGGAHRHLQASHIMALLIGIQKRVAHKSRAHQVRRPCWYHNGAGLPGKTVSPAPVRNSWRPKRNESLNHQLD